MVKLANIILQAVPLVQPGNNSLTQVVNDTSQKCINDTLSSMAQQTVSTSFQIADPQIQNTIQELQKQVATLHLLSYVLLSVMAVGVIVCYVFVRKQKQKQQVTDNSQDCKLMELERRLNERMNTANNALERQIQDMLSEAESRQFQYGQKWHDDNVNASTQINRNSEVTINPVKMQFSNTDGQKHVQTNTYIKYFSLQETGGKLSVRERNLKDDASRSWFVMYIEGDNATYDINKQVTDAILSDQAVLRVCAQDFEPNPDARSIKTLAKGTLRKEGQVWLVTRKIVIELI